MGPTKTYTSQMEVGLDLVQCKTQGISSQQVFDAHKQKPPLAMFACFPTHCTLSLCRLSKACCFKPAFNPTAPPAPSSFLQGFQGTPSLSLACAMESKSWQARRTMCLPLQPSFQPLSHSAMNNLILGYFGLWAWYRPSVGPACGRLTAAWSGGGTLTLG